jgi:hypothetical protein
VEAVAKAKRAQSADRSRYESGDGQQDRAHESVATVEGTGAWLASKRSARHSIAARQSVGANCAVVCRQGADAKWTTTTRFKRSRRSAPAALAARIDRDKACKSFAVADC